MVGQMFLLGGLLAGALKCWSISRRPTTNTKSAFALMFVLLTIGLASCLGTLTRKSSPTFGLALVEGLMGIAMLGFLVTAIVLGILGLIEFSQQRGVYTQGRVQAIWALALALVLGAFAVSGVIRGIQRQSGFAAVPSQSQAGKIFTFDDLNFRFRAPARPWVSFDAAKLNKASKLSFMRRFPEAYFIIIPEKIGTQLDFSTERLAETGKARLQASSTSYRLISEAPLAVNGLDGVLVETEIQLGDYGLHYRHWYCVTNGYAYQLIGYCRSDDQRAVAGELKTMFSGFELLDPNRIASIAGSFTTNYVSPHHHYSVMVKDSGWSAAASPEESFPRAEFAASQADSCLMVIPVRLDDGKLDPEALAAAFLATMDIVYPNENLTNRKPLAEDGLEGMQYDFSRDLKGQTFRYRLKLLQGNGEGYLAAAWTQRRPADADVILNDALGRVRFSASPPLLSPATGGQMSGRERNTQAFVLNQAGLFHLNRGDYEKALRLFRDAIRANEEKSIYVLNALFAWQHLDRPKEALTFLATQPAAVLGLPAVRACRAFFQAQASLVDESITNYASLFATGYRDDSQFTEYVNLLVEQKQFSVALAEVQKYLAAGDSVGIRLLEAQIYRQKQDLTKAISLLKNLREKAPFNSQIAGALAEALIQSGEFSEALTISRELVKDNGNSAYTSYLKGRSELGLRWYREAKVSFNTAMKLAPANKDIRSYFDYVSGLLGEGDNAALLESIDPVALAADLTNAAAVSVPDGYGTNYGAYYIRRIVAAAYLPGKEFKTTEFMQAQILDASGVSAFSTLQIAFDPVAEQIFVNELRVVDATGKTLSTGQVENYYVLDDRAAIGASQKKVLNLPVPGLQPGCQLVAVITRRQSGRFEEFPFLAHSFSVSAPVRESVFFLSGETRGLNYLTSPAVEPVKLPEGLCWRVADPMVARWEPLQPPAANFLPVLWISDASTRWNTVASNYLAFIAERLEPDPELRNQSQKLVAKLDNDDAKIAVLASYVQTNLTYKAIEFGRRARMPNKPADVARNKYGDCKDHSVLLQQMLSAAGISAQLALVHHSSPIQKNLPSLDQFDHMIVYVCAGETGRFVDCTSKGADVAHTIPVGLAGQEALILDARNPRFVTIPDYPADASTVSVEQRIHLTNQNDIVVQETLTLTGVHAVFLREYLLRVPESSRRALLQNQMGMEAAVLTGVRIDSLTAPDKPLRLEFTYSLSKQFRSSNGQLRGVLRAGFARTYLVASPADNRLTPFEITVPMSFESRIYVDAPAGFQAEPLEAMKPGLDPRFAIGEEQVQPQNNGLYLDFKLRQKTGRFKAPDYAAYRDTLAQALSLLEREVVFKVDAQR